MPRTAQGIIAEALNISKTGQVVNGSLAGYTTLATNALNSVLDMLSETVDFARATRQFLFNFNPALVNVQGQGNVVAAAPNPLPIDYQRVQTSGGSTGAQRSSKWYLNGVPYTMIEIDLTEWDEQVMQAGLQSYSYYVAKDMSGGAILANFQGDLDSTSTSIINCATINPLSGQSVAGLPSNIAVGMSIVGGIGPQSVIVPGTTITNVAAPLTLTISQPPTYLNGSPGTAWSGTMQQASLMAGYPANLLLYPPPSGAFSAMVRYQAYMPPLTPAQIANGAYCWFADDNTLIDLLAKRMMGIADDSRLGEYHTLANEEIGKFQKLADDRSNRAQTVQMDRRTFGYDFSRLKNTKTVGW